MELKNFISSFERAAELNSGQFIKDISTEPADEFQSYAYGAETDLKRTWEFLQNYLDIFGKKFFPNVEIELELSPIIGASVSKSGDKFTIKVSLGTYLSCDQLVNIFTASLLQDSEPAYRYIANIEDRPDLGLDYEMFIQKSAIYPYQGATGKRYSNILHIFPYLFDDHNWDYYAPMLSNICVAWIILHELGHIFYRDENLSSSLQNSESKFEELYCDSFATVNIFSLLLRDDFFRFYVHQKGYFQDNWLKIVTTLPCLIIAVLDKKAFCYEKKDADDTHPSFRARFFNVLSSLDAFDVCFQTAANFINSADVVSQKIGLITPQGAQEKLFSKLMAVGWCIEKTDLMARILKIKPLLPWKVTGELNLHGNIHASFMSTQIDNDTARKAFIDILSMHINSNTLTPYEGEGMHFDGYKEWLSVQSLMLGTHLEEIFEPEQAGKMLTELPRFFIRSRYNFHRDEIDRVRGLFEAEKADVSEEEIHRSLREQANGVSTLLVSGIDFQKLLRPAKGSLA